MYPKPYTFVLAAVTAACFAAVAQAQFAPYSDFYNRQLKVSSARPNVNPGRYTYDKYFYNRPSVSPYSNLLRPTGPYVNNYFQYVRPEEQRREKVATSSSSGGYGAQFSPYRQQFYRGRK